MSDLFENEVPRMVIKLGSHKELPDSAAQKFMDEFNILTSENPLSNGTRIYQSALLRVKKGFRNPNTTISLDDIQSKEAGAGNRAMRFVCDLADKHQITIKGYAKGYAHVSTEKLVKWYERYGFISTDIDEDDNGVEMSRYPK